MALYALLAKGAFFKVDHPEQASSSSEIGASASGSSSLKGKNSIGSTSKQSLESEFGHIRLQDNLEGHKAAHNILVELADCVVDYHTGVSVSKPPHAQQEGCSQTFSDERYFCKMEQPASLNSSFTNSDTVRTSHAYIDMGNGIDASRMAENGDAMEGPSEESPCCHLNSRWLSKESRHCASAPSSCNGVMPNDWGRCSVPPSWGGRIVGRRQVKNYAKGNSGIHGEEYDAFINIFEGGSLLYCNMSFEALLSVRKHLEELGFPCKAVNDGLWLQVSNHHLFLSNILYYCTSIIWS